MNIKPWLNRVAVYVLNQHMYVTTETANRRIQKGNWTSTIKTLVYLTTKTLHKHWKTCFSEVVVRLTALMEKS